MEASAFIISNIKELLIKFPIAFVRYEHDEASCTHWLEISPLSIFHQDSAYLEWESDLQDEFISRYPTENIGFISSEDPVGIYRVDFQMGGSEYVSTH